MLIPSLSLFQNILFIIACVSVLLLLAYLILIYSGYVRSKKKVLSDDIDDNADNFRSAGSFLANAFTIKGSIFALAFISTATFFLSIFLEMWLAILISVLMGLIIIFIMNFIDREKIAEDGEFGIVTKTIPEKNSGFGKVMLVETNSEIDAETNGNAIKKGKKVIILENIGNKVIVKKYKRKQK